jgi:localization factor PodJL
MKSGGPWNLRGLRPDAREAARDAARRSGMSVGEWLNSVIRQDDDNDYGEPMQAADYDDDDDDDWRDEPRREMRQEPRRPRRRGRPSRAEERGPPRRQREREADLEHEAVVAREEFGEVHARLDRLTHQLERIARSSAPQLRGAPASPPRVRAAPPPRRGAPLPANDARASVDDAVAEIAERQRVLYGSDLPVPPVAGISPSPPETTAPQPFVSSRQEVAEPPVDLSNLEDQLRYMTSRIEELQPSRELERSVKTFRRDLSDISQQLTEALPRRAVESLETEVRALAQRLDHSRKAGVDMGVLAGLDRGLNEVRDALRGLTPAESLAGFDDAVKALAQKIDLIIAREDPAALQQLETAIGALRGIVSHVASNDTLTKVAEDVRTLAAKVDGVANSAASGQAVSALESRIDTLANALNASTEAGQSVPRELEKLLSGLIEKLEWVQLTHTDHAALGALEDRIAQLIKRLDASDARLGNLEAVERGLADLLVHVDHLRAGKGATPASVMSADAVSSKPVAVEAIVRDVAEIKRSERRTQDSLEAVHGAVEHVVDRLAMIESGMHEGVPSADASSNTNAPLKAEPPLRPEPEPERVAQPAPMPEFVTAAVPAAPPPGADPAERRAGAPRTPIDPNLPPDHPLEPGTTNGPRAMPSAAERIAASEAAVDFAKPPVLAEPAEKPNFIAAARRAAQAAAATAPERFARTESALPRPALSDKPSRLRKVLVAGGAVLVMAGFLHVALRMFQDRTAPNDAAAPAQQASPPTTVVPESNSTSNAPPSGPLILPVPGAASEGSSPSTAPAVPPDPAVHGPQSALPNPAHGTAAPHSAPAAAPAQMPQQQSWLQNYSGDITGALPRREPPPPQLQPPANIAAAPLAASAPAMVNDKLPALIGGPRLRAAAIAGDAAAEFEVANRFTEGHGVPPNDEQAMRWLELAAKQGLAPAQFRLGGFYEKGVVVKKDLAVARDFYAAAAAKGNGKAMHNLAVLYAEGINGPADYRTAAAWFYQAADHGIKDSQYNLAILYARGIGVAQNYAESYKWFALAASGGDADAAKKRDEVATHLDAQALAAAKLAVQKWTAQPQPEDAVSVRTPPGGWDLPEHAEKARGRAAAAKPVSLQPKFN